MKCQKTNQNYVKKLPDQNYKQENGEMMILNK